MPQNLKFHDTILYIVWLSHFIPVRLYTFRRDARLNLQIEDVFPLSSQSDGIKLRLLLSSNESAMR